MVTYPEGVTCEVVIVCLERYLASSLPLGDALATAEHLEACAECAQRIALLRVTITRSAGPARRRG
jgi:anti-sigma factor RsiW